MAEQPTPPPAPERRGAFDRFLDLVERVGNKLPDPAVLFVLALLTVWVLSALLHGTTFELPSKDGPVQKQVTNQLAGKALVQFMVDMVRTFVSFPPLGVVLVALLGVGVAEHSGFIGAALKRLLAITPKVLL